MKELTIFTPTYNRAYILEKAYQSLINQTNKNFIWLIIDDGSTDNTKEKIEEWKKQNIIQIEYIKKNNGGKHTAHNIAIDSATTELTMIALDSDDYLKENAVEIILNNWHKIKNENKNIVGIATFCENNRGKLIIYSNKKKLLECSLNEAICNNYINCSAIFTMKTSYLKQFKFPEIEGEKFFTEAYVYIQMKEPILWIYEGVCVREFREDGLTKNIMKVFLKNPNSWRMYNKLRMENNKSFLLKMKFIIYYITFCILSHQKIITKDLKYKLLTIMFIPIALIVSIYIKRKGNRK